MKYRNILFIVLSLACFLVPSRASTEAVTDTTDGNTTIDGNTTTDAVTTDVTAATTDYITDAPDDDDSESLYWLLILIPVGAGVAIVVYCLCRKNYVSMHNSIIYRYRS